MGQKVNPIGLRVGINRTWDSRWYADGQYGDLLHEDLALREFLFKRLSQAGISRIVIERPAKKARVTIHSARPGVVIGKKGADIEKLRAEVAKMTDSEVHINIVEIRKPEIDAKLVADNIAQQLERRVAFRRAMKRSVQSAMRLGAEGIRINCKRAPGDEGVKETKSPEIQADGKKDIPEPNSLSAHAVAAPFVSEVTPPATHAEQGAVVVAAPGEKRNCGHRTRRPCRSDGRGHRIR